MKRMRLLMLMVMTALLICSASFTSYAYTEEEKAQAKAWLSAHGYSPDWGGASQAYQDYLNGKFDEELGVDVNGDGIPATTQAGTESGSTQTKTETTTEESSEETTQESAQADDEEAGKPDKAVATKSEDDDTNAGASDGKRDENAQEADAPLTEQLTEDTQDTEDTDVAIDKDVSEKGLRLEGYQVVMIAIVAIVAVCFLLLYFKKRNVTDEADAMETEE